MYMNKLSILTLSFLLSSTLFAQQSHVSIQYDPQRNTENITPFSAQVISPEVHDDHTVTFRVKAPDAKEVKLTVLARGLSVNNELQYTDEATLGRSIVNRVPFKG